MDFEAMAVDRDVAWCVKAAMEIQKAFIRRDTVALVRLSQQALARRPSALALWTSGVGTLFADSTLWQHTSMQARDLAHQV